MVAFEEAHNLATMTVEELTSNLQAREERMNEKQTEKPITQVLQAQLTVKGDQNDETTKKASNARGRGRGRGRG